METDPFADLDGAPTPERQPGEASAVNRDQSADEKPQRVLFGRKTEPAPEVAEAWARLEGERRSIGQVAADLRANATETIERVAQHRDGIGWAIVAIAIAYFCFLFVPLMVINHRNFGNNHFDTGVFDQAAHLLAHGKHFMTGRGLNVFGHHANFGLYLFAPFYWVGWGGPIVLNIAQVLSLAAAAVPVYLIARNRTESVTIGVVIAIAFLMHFTVSTTINEAFHPELMAVPALFAAFHLADRGRWAWYAAALAYAVIWKEDISLFVGMLGVYLFFSRSKVMGSLTTATAALYFMVVTMLVIPGFSESGASFYGGDYGVLGDSGAEVALNAVFFEQDETFRLLDEHDAPGYLADLGQPYGWLSYLSPHWMLLALPQLAANLLNVHGLAANPMLHYAAMPLVAVTLGLVAVFRARRNPWLRAGLAVWLLVFSFNTAHTRGFTPLSQNYTTGVWQLYDNDRTAQMEGAKALIPGSAAVSATYNMAPHFTARDDIYMFPNPFRRDYWGIGELPELHDPAVIDYLVLDRAVLSPESEALVDDLGAEFEVIYENGAVVVLRRR